ncbi:hypothetical protein HYPBUDRAFT_112353 [Hyphopichia burtonii NRRL Y-1933]|uniref:Uncharacterized protein n=1 Tax=Hyphopichia burtonii NRRL Y-1933 TaxID=984485 RepID=A0A1E4RFU3_9ASCO|nr:hypothetical protein HYPBUDRAFT_112353 [Hyphopichia burtonii NRRL Y-1933]ODV66129.1 hypothetical protein HYPBUDRAFT_112353 [Hyphopichia burtonii NRRL Y-1933]
MSIPILTIPEGAYDLSAYTSTPTRYGQRQSRLLKYLINLTKGSSVTITLVYLLAIFLIKPLLETKTERHYDYLEFYRGKLRDLYISLIGRVSYIPIVAINRNGKLHSDACVQTDEAENQPDSLNQGTLVKKMGKLSKVLRECESFNIDELPHYKTTSYSVKDFQNNIDMVYFNSNEIFSVDVNHENGLKKKNLASDIKHEIRHMKGLFMSGQV